jgi:hypothetical protein
MQEVGHVPLITDTSVVGWIKRWHRNPRMALPNDAPMCVLFARLRRRLMEHDVQSIEQLMARIQASRASASRKQALSTLVAAWMRRVEQVEAFLSSRGFQQAPRINTLIAHYVLTCVSKQPSIHHGWIEVVWTKLDQRQRRRVYYTYVEAIARRSTLPTVRLALSTLYQQGFPVDQRVRSIVSRSHPASGIQRVRTTPPTLVDMTQLLQSTYANKQYKRAERILHRLEAYEFDIRLINVIFHGELSSSAFLRSKKGIQAAVDLARHLHATYPIKDDPYALTILLHHANRKRLYHEARSLLEQHEHEQGWMDVPLLTEMLKTSVATGQAMDRKQFALVEDRWSASHAPFHTWDKDLHNVVLSMAIVHYLKRNDMYGLLKWMAASPFIPHKGD